MAKGREHFALDWIKSELLETLNDSRQALEAYVDSDNDETRMRACLTGLHQVHGTLVMLELQGVSLLADHLERVAQELHNGSIQAESSAAQSLMQGILELPGHIDEIQRGQPDSVRPVAQLVNELRHHIGEAPLVPEGDYADIRAATFRDHPKFFQIIEKSGHLIVFLLGDGVEFMIVAGGTFHSQAQESHCGCIGSILNIFLSKFFIYRSSFGSDWMVPMESRSELLVPCCIRQ